MEGMERKEAEARVFLSGKKILPYPRELVLVAVV
jgi:hypothetical protein